MKEYPIISKELTGNDRPELRLALIAILCVLIFGMVGYVAIEGWSYFDALYMTVITLSTVGFQEVHPLSHPGRAFTMVLIVLGVGIAAVTIRALTSKLLQHQIRWFFERRDMTKEIEKLDGHTIFCGYGRLCKYAAKHYKDRDDRLVIIEVNEERAREAERDGYLVVCGNAAQEDVLLKAGIMRAAKLVTLVSTDADNLYIVLSSRELNPKLFICSRADDQASEKRLTRAGADKLMSPYRIGGVKIAQGLLRPLVNDFLDLAGPDNKSELQIEEMRVPAGSPLAGKTLQDSALRDKTNVMVVAVIAPSGEMTFNPGGSVTLQEGATLIGLGFRADFSALETLMVPS